MKSVVVVPHSHLWKDEFEAEARQISDTLGENVSAIHHIGSTAILTIYAKPVIDLLLEVRDLAMLDAQSSSMASLGYEVMGEFGISGRRYFRKDDERGIRTDQVHAFEVGSPESERHLAFRDYLISHPEDAETYSELKRKLAESHPCDMDAYMDGKDSFIKEIEHKAAVWRIRQAGQRLG